MRKHYHLLKYDDATTTVVIVHGVTRKKEHVINLCSRGPLKRNVLISLNLAMTSYFQY